MIELSVSVPLLVSFCGLIVTAINVIAKVHEVHKYESRCSSQNPFLAVKKEVEAKNISRLFSQEIEIHIIVNGREITKTISVDNFNHCRFEEWADSVDDGLFSYDLSDSFMYADGVPAVKVWRLVMWFKVESDLCQQEIQGLLPF